jgi:hypothetical protein
VVTDIKWDAPTSTCINGGQIKVETVASNLLMAINKA